MWKVGKTFIYFVATCGSVLMLIGVLLTMKEANDFTMLLLSNVCVLIVFSRVPEFVLKCYVSATGAAERFSSTEDVDEDSFSCPL